MKRFLTLLILFATSLAYGQTIRADYAEIKNWVKARGWTSTSYTISQLAGLSAWTGTIVSVTDGNPDCTTGGGSAKLFCRFNGTTWDTWGGNTATGLLFSASANYNSVPPSGAYLLDWIVPTYSPAVTITIPANCSGSTFKARTAATGSTVFTVAKNGSSICTATVAISGTTATWAGTGSSTTLTTGDELTIVGGGDASLAGITISIAGTR